MKPIRPYPAYAARTTPQVRIVINVSAGEPTPAQRALEEHRRVTELASRAMARRVAEPTGIDALGMPTFEGAPSPEEARSPSQQSGDADRQPSQSLPRP